MRTWAKSSLYLAVGLVAAGFLLIFFAWNGASEKDFVQGQFPYLLSGGLTGLGFILCGLTLALTQSFRRDVLSLQDRLDALLDQLAASGSGPTPLAAVPDLDGAFATTGSTYHVPSCRTIQNRAGVELVDVQAVEARGLAACRVCRPAARTA